MRNSRIVPLLIIGVFFIAGCMANIDIQEIHDRPGWPGYITKNVSEFDGKRYISMAPAYLGDASNMLRLGLEWNSSLPVDKYMLVAEWAEPINFSPNSSFGINIDGNRIDLRPVDRREYGTSIDRVLESSSSFAPATILHNQTHKRFWISKSEVSEIIEAKKVVVRVEFLKSYWEERLEPTPEATDIYNEYPYIWAKAGFARFLTEQFSN